MPATYATYNGIDLPKQFSYKPVSPLTRHEIIDTCGGTVIHDAGETTASDNDIEFSMQAITQDEWAQFLTWRKNDPANGAAFTGYWGDKHTVRFLELESSRAYSGGLFDVNGKFRVISTQAYGENSAGTPVT